jgi:predicted NAD/FAD-binding protein
MRIAIIGSGISGLAAAHLLHPAHDLTIFEASDHVGGHTRTVPVAREGHAYAVDTGFIVFNRRTYPTFCTLIDRLGVAAQPTEMSFAVRCERSGIEYLGSSINGLFAQRRNLLSPSFHRLWWDILRFNKLTKDLLDAESEVSVGAILDRHGFSDRFVELYLGPITASIWSMPASDLRRFPARFMARFLENHGMNTVDDRPQWFTITGGSWTYVKALIKPFAERIRLNTPVQSVRRLPTHVEVIADQGVEVFDQIIIAAHSDQALGLLADPSQAEREVLGAIPYHRNRVVLHTDTTHMPRLRKVWAAWNYRVPAGPEAAPQVTYWMNRLQHLTASTEFLVTLNPVDLPAGTIRCIDDAHPHYTAAAPAAQARWADVNGVNRTWFAGAWWGNGFHEDGCASGVRVAAGLGRPL